MGGETSCDSTLIANVGARQFFDAVKVISTSFPDATKKNKYFSKTVKSIFDSLKNIPETEADFGFVISGGNLGPMFVDTLMFRLTYPQCITKISLRKSGLKSTDAKKIASFIMSTPYLKQFDASENDFGDSASYIISSTIGHKNLNSIQLEECKVNDTSVEPLIRLLSFSRSIETIRLNPMRVSAKNIEELKKAIFANRSVTNLMLTNSLETDANRTVDRNSFINEFVDSVARSPFQRLFRSKIDAFKSVKGREMLMGRAKQKEKARGTELFDKLENVDERARTTEVGESVEKTAQLRSGHAEMVGRRPNMEDVSVILNDTPTKGAALFGLFDGHGGREAAEFASSHLPASLTELMKANDEDTAYTVAFRRLQADMRPWCVYVGTTALLASVNGDRLTVANIGDTRCVLCRDGKAVRLSVDHKPDLPEETAFVHSKGGVVRDGRVGGMLAVSRAFGDGFLGECVNSTPHITHETLTPQDRFLILACDGVWDVISDQKAIDIVLPEIDPLEAARKLRDAAFELESSDNISVIVVFLPGMTEGDIDEE